MARWTRWFLILLTLAIVPSALAHLLRWAGFPGWSTLIAVSGIIAWAVYLLVGSYQLWADRRTQWVFWPMATWLVLTVISFLVVFEHPRMAIALSGAWGMLVMFLLAVWLLRIAMTPSNPVFAMAKITLQEAMRAKLAALFIGALIVLLALLPNMMDPGERIQYRMQFFLNWALLFTSVSLSAMTIFLASSLITEDIKRRQIFMIAVKPISRLEYLMGRWLGIAALTLVLIVISGVGIFIFASVVEAGPDQGRGDRMMMENEVMVARDGVVPEPLDDAYIEEETKKQLKRLRELNPEEWGDPNAPEDEQRPLTPKQEGLLRQDAINRWHQIAPYGYQTFVFKGLDRAKEMGDYVVLQYKPTMGKSAPDKMVRLVFQINGQFWPQRPVMTPDGRTATAVMPIISPNRRRHQLEIPTWFIGDNGILEIRVHNNDPRNVVYSNRKAPVFPSSVNFTPGADFGILYRVDGFTVNFIRTMIVLWVKLLFLAMLGQLAGTFLGFHIAALMAFLVFAVSEGAAFIDESLELYQELNVVGEPFFSQLGIAWDTFWDRISRDMYWSAFRIVIRVTGHVVLFFVPSFGDYQPIGLVSKGRLVSWEMVGKAVLYVGVLWTGFCTLMAWLIFRRRELAKVTV